MLPEPENIKRCLTCDKPLKGRSDKKYCSDACRNAYNNALKSHTNNLTRNINNTLGRNRRILESLLSAPNETHKVPREKLERMGFNFRYITHSYKTRSGNLYLYCYDFGYLPLDNDWILIVKAKEN